MPLARELRIVQKMGRNFLRAIQIKPGSMGAAIPARLDSEQELAGGVLPAAARHRSQPHRPRCDAATDASGARCREPDAQPWARRSSVLSAATDLSCSSRLA